MTDQAYYLQKAVHAALVASPGLVALVPADNVGDFGGVPTKFPSIIMGEAQIVDEGQRIDRSVVRVYLTCHIWTREPYLNQVKKIGNEIRVLIPAAGAASLDSFHLGDLRLETIRYVRDPSGDNGHGIVTLNALVATI